MNINDEKNYGRDYKWTSEIIWFDSDFTKGEPEEVHWLVHGHTGSQGSAGDRHSLGFLSPQIATDI